jgi:hypothetical protein
VELCRAGIRLGLESVPFWTIRPNLTPVEACAGTGHADPFEACAGTGHADPFEACARTGHADPFEACAGTGSVRR